MAFYVKRVKSAEHCPKVICNHALQEGYLPCFLIFRRSSVMHLLYRDAMCHFDRLLRRTMSRFPGPRDYTTGTERALFAFSGTTCYFPGCTAKVLIFVGSEPVSNVQIAHISGANQNSPRYDASMSDDERRAFANLILLCTPHHTIVDRLHPEDFPIDVLTGWKIGHERDAGIDQGALVTMTDEHLVELIESAVKSFGPQRSVVVDLGLGIANLPNRKILFLPTSTASSFFDMYSDLGPPVVIVTVRNQGALKSFVDSHTLRLFPSGTSLMSADHFPGTNPQLPYELEVGESASWMYLLFVIEPIITVLRTQGDSISCLTGEIVLGSGETLTSNELPIELLGSEFRLK